MKKSEKPIHKIGIYVLIRLLILVIPIAIVILIVELNPPNYSEKRGHTDPYLGVAIWAGLWTIIVISLVMLEIIYKSYRKHRKSNTKNE